MASILKRYLEANTIFFLLRKVNRFKVLFVTCLMSYTDGIFFNLIQHAFIGLLLYIWNHVSCWGIEITAKTTYRNSFITKVSY